MIQKKITLLHTVWGLSVLFLQDMRMSQYTRLEVTTERYSKDHIASNQRGKISLCKRGLG